MRETTSGAMSFALYYLAKHPAVLRLVQREAATLARGEMTDGAGVLDDGGPVVIPEGGTF